MHLKLGPNGVNTLKNAADQQIRPRTRCRDPHKTRNHLSSAFLRRQPARKTFPNQQNTIHTSESIQGLQIYANDLNNIWNDFIIITLFVLIRKWKKATKTSYISYRARIFGYDKPFPYPPIQIISIHAYASIFVSKWIDAYSYLHTNWCLLPIGCLPCIHAFCFSGPEVVIVA